MLVVLPGLDASSIKHNIFPFTNLVLCGMVPLEAASETRKVCDLGSSTARRILGRKVDYWPSYGSGSYVYLFE